jgi:nucleotide-binding universal stress UspA family protein
VSPITTVVCPVDGSDLSDRALAFAADLCRSTGAALVVLMVRPYVTMPALWLAAPAATALDTPGAHARALETLRDSVTRVIDPSLARFVVTEGDVVSEIVRVATEEQADAVVVATHGLSGFDRLVLGSVTEKLLRKTPCPLWVVPPSAARSRPIGDSPVVVCGLDRSQSSRNAIAHAAELARQPGASLVLVHAFEDFSNEDPRFAHHFNSDACWRAAEPEIRAAYQAILPEELRSAGRHELVTMRGRPYRVLLEVAHARGADAIVIGAAGWNPPLGSTAVHVVRQAECPVLVVPA